MTLPPERLARLAAAPSLLVASDFDGTIAPIVSDPRDARPIPAALDALTRLAALPRTHVAVISGRARADLVDLSGAPLNVLLVGSHGAEFGAAETPGLSDSERTLLERVERDVAVIAAGGAGLIVEHKPAGVALHYRNADADTAQRAVAALLEGPARLDGVHPRHGKKVVELSVVGTTKADALERVRRRQQPDAVVFLGDDLTDEDAFAHLRESDVGVKVGPGDSRAPYRLASPHEVGQLLTQLAQLRASVLRTDASPTLPGRPA